MVTDGIVRRNRTSWRDTSYERTVMNVDAANDNPTIGFKPDQDRGLLEPDSLILTANPLMSAARKSTAPDQMLATL